MRSFVRDRGCLVFAQNGSHDYVRMAYALALSLKVTQPLDHHLSIVVTPGTYIEDRYLDVFDCVLDVPWIDEAKDDKWKLANEWKAYHVTPYSHTLKLDADMLFTRDINVWWEIAERYDVLFPRDVMTYRGAPIVSDICRKTFTASHLPNVYTAMMFFKYSDRAQQLFEMAEVIFHNWERFSFKFLDPADRPKRATTDVVFALATKLIGADKEFFSPTRCPTFTHMKPELQQWPAGHSSDWTQHVNASVSVAGEVKIGRYNQFYPLHYSHKSFLTDKIISTYEKMLGIR